MNKIENQLKKSAPEIIGVKVKWFPVVLRANKSVERFHGCQKVDVVEELDNFVIEPPAIPLVQVLAEVVLVKQCGPVSRHVTKIAVADDVTNKVGLLRPTWW